MPRTRQGGFTLLEMLVAVLVLTLLVSLVYGMVRMAARSWESGSARIEATDTLRIGWTFAQRALNNARAVPSKNEEVAGVHFFGAPQALEFVADLPAYLGTGGLTALGLGLEPDPAGEHRRLVLRRIPLADYEQASEDPDSLQHAVLAEAVTDLKFSYYGSPERDLGPDWQGEWRGLTQLPVLVRMEVELADGSHWPVLVAHPRLGVGRQEEEIINDGSNDPPAPLPDAAEPPPPDEN